MQIFSPSLRPASLDIGESVCQQAVIAEERKGEDRTAQLHGRVYRIQ